MICQYKGQDVCPECTKCDRSVEYSLLEVAGRSEVAFNFGFALASEVVVESKSFYISESLSDRISESYILVEDQSSKAGINHFCKTKSNSPLYIGNHRVNNTLQSSQVESIESVNEFVKYVDSIMQPVIPQTRKPRKTQHNTTENITSEPASTACSTTEVIVIELTKHDFKFVIDARLPPVLRLVVLKPNNCPAWKPFAVSLVSFGKYLGLITLPMLLQNVLFSALNQVDIIGLLYYVQPRDDTLLSEVIQVLSGLECDNSFQFSSKHASFTSNQSVLILLGVKGSKLALTGWPAALNLIADEQLNWMVTTTVNGHQSNVQSLYKCTQQVMAEETLALFTLLAFTLFFFFNYLLDHCSPKCSRLAMLVKETYFFARICLSGVLYWLFFSNLTMLIVKVRLIKSGIFGLADFAACHIRAFTLVLPHYLSHEDSHDARNNFTQTRTYRRLRQLIIGLTLKIEGLKKQIRESRARQQMHPNTLDVVEVRTGVSLQASRGILSVRSERIKLQRVAKVNYFNYKLLNTLRDPRSWDPCNFAIVIGKYHRDLRRLRDLHK